MRTQSVAGGQQKATVRTQSIRGRGTTEGDSENTNYLLAKKKKYAMKKKVRKPIHLNRARRAV